MSAVPRKLAALGLFLAVIGATATPAEAARVASARIDLHPNHNTLGNLADFGILSGISSPATRAGADVRFPLRLGRLDPDANFAGVLDGLGGLTYTSDDDGRTVSFASPTIVIRKKTVNVQMTVNGRSHRVATLASPTRKGTDSAFQLKGLARFNRAGASLLGETFGLAYPQRDTPLGVLTITARLRR